MHENMHLKQQNIKLKIPKHLQQTTKLYTI